MALDPQAEVEGPAHCPQALSRFYPTGELFNLGAVDIWARSFLAVEGCPGHAGYLVASLASGLGINSLPSSLNL